MKNILQVGAKALETKSKQVEDPKSPETQTLVKNLLKLCRKYEDIAGGLSAPQIGVNSNVMIVRRVDLEEQYNKKHKEIPSDIMKDIWMPMINPKIIKKGKRKSTFWEGCLSVEKGEVFGPVTRPSLIKVEYFDRYGKKHTKTAVDFFAHVIQHEYDHLQGVLFVKYVKNPDNLWKSKEIDDYIKKHGDLPEIV